mmetsp:Transcript_16132/g.51768  ORF Transcript_16132/g.51768 Transcript_16132/m.51768 type:complete len:661 (-) Transcript_16132:78-2060(-)
MAVAVLPACGSKLGMGRPLLLEAIEVGSDQLAVVRSRPPTAASGGCSPLPSRASARGRESVEALAAKVGRLRQALAELEQGRLEAAEAVGRLTRAQVSEVKQLARNPPESIRRTLSAAWILLHNKRFSGRTTVRFDEVKQWPLLQRMLADEDFVKGVLSLEPAHLAELPHVTTYVASTYLGINASGDQERSSSILSTASARSTRLCRRSDGNVHLPKVPLDVAAVARASEPCGRLLEWIIRLVRESAEYRQLSTELTQAEVELSKSEALFEKLDLKAAVVMDAAEAMSSARTRPFQETHLLLGPRRGPTIPPFLKPLSIPLPLASADVSALGAEVLSGRQLLGRVAEPRLQSARKALGATLPALLTSSPSSSPSSKAKSGEAPVTTAHKSVVLEPVAQKPVLVAKAQATAAAMGPPKPPLAKVELHVTASLASLHQQLNRLRIPFRHKNSEIDEADSSQTQILSSLVRLLKEHRGRLKLRLVGCHEFGELPYVAFARAQAVAVALAEAMADDLAITGHGLLPRGWLRAEGGEDLGRCVLPLPLMELVPLYGPISREVASYSAPVGVYFDLRDVTLAREARAIVEEMAAYLKAEGTSCCIEGHADRAEPADFAERRAQAVAAEFIKLGVNAQKIQKLAHDAMCPLSRHAAPNRRVEVYLVD